MERPDAESMAGSRRISPSRTIITSTRNEQWGHNRNRRYRVSFHRVCIRLDGRTLQGMKESDLHKEFIAWLNARRIPFLHSRTDRRTTTALGDPDFFVLWEGRVLGIECKIDKNKLSDAQEKRIAYLKQAGVRVEVARTLQECIVAVTLHLGQQNALASLPSSGKWHRSLDLQGQIGSCKTSTETWEAYP